MKSINHKEYVVKSFDGTIYHYKGSKIHRTDGPAVECDDGFKLWFYNGARINCSSQEEFEKLLKLKAFW